MLSVILRFLSSILSHIRPKKNAPALPEARVVRMVSTPEPVAPSTFEVSPAPVGAASSTTTVSTEDNSSRLILQLTRLPSDRVEGIYKVGSDTSAMPERMRWLQPDAAGSYLADLADRVVVSDMFRSPESSLQAVREGRGAQPPGYSAHNYGLAIDLDTKATMKRAGLKDKEALDLFMESCGWFCHRRDHRNDFEAWHFNFLGKGADASGKWGSPVEKEMQRRWSRYWTDVPVKTWQGWLRDQKCYSGAIDGLAGPLTREAVRALQRKWGRPETGKMDARTLRTLAYVTNRVVEVVL